MNCIMVSIRGRLPLEGSLIHSSQPNCPLSALIFLWSYNNNCTFSLQELHASWPSLSKCFVTNAMAVAQRVQILAPKPVEVAMEMAW